MHPDITKHFQTGEDFSRYQHLNSMALVGYTKSDKILARYITTDRVRAHDQILYIEMEKIGVDMEGDFVFGRSYFEYAISTEAGDCGSLAIAFATPFNRKIFAMHCSGGYGEYSGQGIPVSFEMLMHMLKNFSYEPQMAPVLDANMMELSGFKCEEIEPHTFEIKFDRPYEGNYALLGKMVKPMYQARETNLRPSPIAGVLKPPSKAPAQLKPFVNDKGERVDPMVLAVAKVTVAPAPNSLELGYIKAATRDVFTKYAVNRRGRVLSYEEAVNGVDGEEFLFGINRQSSPGYPWILQRKGSGKTQWLGSEGEYKDSPELRAAVMELEETALQGLRLPVYWVDTLKDERRPLDRVASGKTRLFSVGNMAYNVLFRQYFLDFFIHLMKERVRVESCVGVNPYSNDWSTIAKTLKEVGNTMIAGDFSNFDGTLCSVVLWEILDRINEWYDEWIHPEDEGEEGMASRVRRVLWCEIVHSLHINGNVVYGWHHSQPSGDPGTAIINSIYNSVVVRVAWLHATINNPDMHSLKAFSKNVRMVTYGDDNIISVSPAAQFFSQKEVTVQLAKLGLTYTDETKSGEDKGFRPLEEVNFLKRAFVWDKEFCRYIAPLEFDTVLEMTNWVHGEVDQHSNASQILEMSAIELAIHGEAEFEKWAPKYRKAAEKLTCGAHIEEFFVYRTKQQEQLGLSPARGMDKWSFMSMQQIPVRN